MAVVRRIKCEVSDIEQLGDKTYSLILDAEKKLPRFQAGQFCHLTIDQYDPSGFWPESRVFSIASSPKKRNHLRICFSVVGSYTKRMEQELRVGSLVWIKLPYGDFIVRDHSITCLIAGGTGVSPFLPLIESIDEDRLNPIYLFYGVRSTNHLIDFLKLKETAENVSNFYLVLFSENGFPENGEWGDNSHCRYLNGQISVDEVVSSLSDNDDLGIYVSGPPQMLEFWKKELNTQGVDQNSIFIDNWG